MYAQSIQLHPMLHYAQPKPGVERNTKAQHTTFVAPNHDEDDFSHLQLHETIQDHAHYLRLIASAFDDYCADPPTDYSDECAISTDDESDEACSPISINGSYKYSPVTITKPKRGSDCKTHKRRPAMSEGEKDRERPAAKQAIPVTRITGPQMSLWPMPMDQESYQKS
ncbi:hypothetical protein B0I35DRAFT_406935 [Stachybotrys elegans]|uniref:Uncharacterized protein n=1 Tax=Stachybotrys elegans TaxID=80388 RepID=A0A8K0SV19_9HYPO|nr:hypothetical protein B0I35DRAFT_406935 [Stachybotrys elegans]